MSELEFTPCEAAYITDLPHREVQKAIDEDWFDSDARRVHGTSRRRLGPAELTHLRAVKDAAGHAIFTRDAKKLVHRQVLDRMPSIAIVCSTCPSSIVRDVEQSTSRGATSTYPLVDCCFDVRIEARTAQRPEWATPKSTYRNVFVCHHEKALRWAKLRSCFASIDEQLKEPVHVASNLLIDISSSWRQIFDRFVRATAAQLVIVSDPLIRGGEPVVCGTRIPAYLLHELAEQGASNEELLADYPALDEDKLDLALLYTKTHARLGRPKERPWRLPAGAS